MRYGMGWQRDLPNFRDFSPENDEIKKMLKGSKALKATPPKGPASVDLSKWWSPIEDQENIGSCTEHAGIGLLSRINHQGA